MGKDKDLDTMTRADFEQLFEDHTERFVKVLGETESRLNKRMNSHDDRFDDMDKRFDRLERNTHDDITVLFQEVHKIKKHVGMKVEEEV